jgi:hypothetical protein
VASGGFAKWEVNATQGVLGKAFLPFGLSAGGVRPGPSLRRHALLGARNIDGRGFDTEANRPTNLQIPLRRK